MPNLVVFSTDVSNRSRRIDESTYSSGTIGGKRLTARSFAETHLVVVAATQSQLMLVVKESKGLLDAVPKKSCSRAGPNAKLCGKVSHESNVFNLKRAKERTPFVVNVDDAQNSHGAKRLQRFMLFLRS